jgi:hypothetical protein
MDRKIFVATAMVGCLIFCHSSAAAAVLNKTINELENSHQTWEIDNSKDNNVVFSENGSIAVNGNGEPDSGVAIEVGFGGNASTYSLGDKQKSLLTVTFDNDARVPTELKESENNEIKAHICAINTIADQPAGGINLAEGANLAIRGDNGHCPVMIAYSRVAEGGSVATTIQAMATNHVDIHSTATLTAFSFSPSASASTGTGAASATENGTSTVNSLDVRFGDRNKLEAVSISTSTSTSASTGIGAASAIANGPSTVNSLDVRFGDRNKLGAISTSTSTSASTGIGAASTNGVSTASAVRVNLNGSQDVVVLAHAPSASSIKVNAFGADNTDKDANEFGWRVGIFAAGEETTEGEEIVAKPIAQDSEVTIMAAKLAEASITAITLGAAQGTSNADYARAFALGEDFKIYIGGMANSTDSGFTPIPANGKNNIVKIVGAISKAQNSASTEGSSLTIDSGWVVKTYGPVEDLARIDIKGGAKWNVYGPASNLPEIHVQSGVLHLTKGNQIEDEEDEGVKTIVKDYPWDGSSGGSLTLKEGHKVTLYVDSSSAEISPTPFSGTFRRVNGYVSIDAGMENALTFKGGKIGLEKVDKNEEKTAGYWLIRSEADENVAAVAKLLGINDSFNPKNFIQENINLYRLTNDYAASLFAPKEGEALATTYAWLDDESAAYLFNDRENGISGLYIGTKQEQSARSQGEVYVNVELASLAVVAHDLLINAISDRLTHVKGCLADPFIHVIYGHVCQDKLTRRGYHSNMGGFVVGADNVWDFPNERYFRFGAAFGYVYGKTNFSGSAVGVKESAKHDIYVIELFGAYEFFNDKRLKTNVGLTFGYGRGSDRLDLGSNVRGTAPRDTKIKSNNISLGIEFLKNLYAYKGYQFGLWLRANYNHIAQKEHDEMITAVMGTQQVPSVGHNLLTTVLGLNVEREILNPEHADKKWLLSLKAGWEYQLMRKHSDATIPFVNDFGRSEIMPTYGQPGKHAAVALLGVSKKLNVHWSVVGSYMLRFNSDISTHNLSCGAEYSF